MNHWRSSGCNIKTIARLFWTKTWNIFSLSGSPENGIVWSCDRVADGPLVEPANQSNHLFSVHVNRTIWSLSFILFIIMLTKQWQRECTSSLTAFIFFFLYKLLQHGGRHGNTIRIAHSNFSSSWFLSLFSLLAASVFTAQISMSAKSPWMCAMAASAPTPRGRTSACVTTVSCRRRIWRPVWVTTHSQSAVTPHVALLCVMFSFSVQRPWEDENKAASSVCFSKQKTFLLCCWVKRL